MKKLDIRRKPTLLADNNLSKVRKQKKAKESRQSYNNLRTIRKRKKKRDFAKQPHASCKKESDLPLDRDRLCAKIIECNGLVSYVAAFLGVNQTTVYGWKAKFEWMEEAFQLAREKTIDLGEHSLIKNVRQGAESSTQYLLSTLGKKRGYIKDREGGYNNGLHRQFENFNERELNKRLRENLKIIETLKGE